MNAPVELTATTALTRYEAARHALAEAKSVDEVKDIHDKAAALAEYARRARDGKLIADATAIRKRAERRLGELMEEQRKAGKLAKGTRGSKTKGARVAGGPTLSDQGIDKHLADRARKAAAMPAAKFDEQVERSIKIAVAATEGDAAVVKAARKDQQAAKKARRMSREQDLAGKILALPDRRYGVLLSDPPWQFRPWSRESGLDRSPDNHYPTLPLEEICALPVNGLAADDCVLFLWATPPMLPQALAVMAAWGFDYRSHFVWVKDRAGTGYWNRSRHELLLVGVRGKVPAPASGSQFDSVQTSAAAAHSEKPEWQYRLIEKHYPNLTRLELFARGQARKGWDAWGNEAEVLPAMPFSGGHPPCRSKIS